MTIKKAGAIFAAVWVGFTFALTLGEASGVLLHDLPRIHERACRLEGGGLPDDFCTMRPATMTFVRRESEETTFTLSVLIARTPAQRAAGYQHVPREIIAGSAILFQFDRETRSGFHMCNVTAALDIVWIRQDGTPVDGVRMEPGKREAIVSRCPYVYTPGGTEAYRYALEVPADLLTSVGFVLDEAVNWRVVTIDDEPL